MTIYQLLIRTVDQINSTDEIKNYQLMKRGDVIAVRDENHIWGSKELNNLDSIIIKVDLTKEQAESLVTPEFSNDLTKNYILRKRGLKIDLDNLDLNNIKIQVKEKILIPNQIEPIIDNVIG